MPAAMRDPILLQESGATRQACQRFARNWATRSLTPPHDRAFSSTLTRAVMWGRAVPRGVVNYPRIDGMQGVGVKFPSAPLSQQRRSQPCTLFNVAASCAARPLEDRVEIRLVARQL